MKSTKFLLGLFLSSLLYSSPLFAQSGDDRHPMLRDKFTVGLGAFINQKNVKFRVDGSVPGEDIDFDDIWGVDSNDTSFAGVMRWRFGEKWSLWGQFFDTSDGATAVLEEDIHWEDDVLKAGSSVGAGVDLSVARIFFGRIFSAGPRHEFGIGAGFHWLEIGAFVEGEFFVNDESTGFRRDQVDAAAPLPNIGGWYDYAFSPKWIGRARLDWLQVSLGDFSGGLWNSSVGIQYQAFRNVGFGLAYQYFKLDVDVDKSDWNGNADLQYNGPFLSVTANW
jgi:hypothetical protein